MGYYFARWICKKKFNQENRVNCEKYAASIWQNWLKNLLLRILSCQFYERVLFCIQDTLKGANIVLISHEQSSNRVLSHIFLPEYAIFLAEIYLPYLHFPCVPICCFFNFYYLSSSFMFVVALSFAPHSSTFLSPISLDLITHTEFNKKSFTEMSIQISMWNLSFWDPLSGGWCYPLLEQDSL